GEPLDFGRRPRTAHPPSSPTARSGSGGMRELREKECHFLNGTQQVRLLLRSFYNRQEIDYFDSDLGKYVAVTPLGQPDVDKWNRDEVYLQYWKAQVDSVCRHNYRLYKMLFWPTVTISPTKMDPASPNTILLCTARGFYPLEIEVRWLKNGQLEEEGVAFGEELQNGDWTYQLQVILETQPQWGDVYTCQVEHASLEAPITVQWAFPSLKGGWILPLAVPDPHCGEGAGRGNPLCVFPADPLKIPNLN
uniref:Ig-like domain-containing protein n=1 Tax=Naja naja TaxID=35670 RepID=A0A8C6VDH4_NAJNA